MNNQTSNISGIGGLFEYAYYATNSAFGLGLIAMIFLLSFGATSMLNIGRAFASASFITFIFSVYFARIGLLTPTAPFILIAMSVIGFFWAQSERSASY